jgi:hypothetical protein
LGLLISYAQAKKYNGQELSFLPSHFTRDSSQDFEEEVEKEGEREKERLSVCVFVCERERDDRRNVSFIITIHYITGLATYLFQGTRLNGIRDCPRQ